jgi:hypothetical protein
MKIVALEEEELTVSELAELAKEGPVVLTQAGKPVLAVNDLSGTDWASLFLANNPRFLALIEESRQSYRKQGGIGLKELCQELELKGSRRRAPRKKKA